LFAAGELTQAKVLVVIDPGGPATTAERVTELIGPIACGEADFLALACPHTPETEGLIGATELAMLPVGAVLINISRGTVVDQQALVEALQSGHLGGAALDVFDPEPLPPGDPLWTMPNVIISPHSASTADTENRKLTRLFCDNLKRYLAGESLINVLDTGLLY
jgi:phosphoglycerate dehydrogenase-like enzyme